ncbi:transposase [Burkholderia ambifaria]|nr:transposase [Burkholderia ambifaria]
MSKALGYCSQVRGGALPANAVIRWAGEFLAVACWIYWWVDGIHAGAHGVDFDRHVSLWGIVGVMPSGSKDRVAIVDGWRKLKYSWVKLPLDLKARVLRVGPLLNVRDGVMGLWAAFDEMFQQTRRQRCWCRKIGNVHTALPKSQQGKRKAAHAKVWSVATRVDAIRENISGLL